MFTLQGILSQQADELIGKPVSQVSFKPQHLCLNTIFDSSSSQRPSQVLSLFFGFFYLPMLFSISIVRLASSSISSVIRSSSVPMRSNYNTISCDPLKSHQRITLQHPKKENSISSDFFCCSNYVIVCWLASSYLPVKAASSFSTNNW